MAKPRRVTLSTNPKKEELTELRLGDVVYLDGTIYTAREGVYKRALEEKANFPVDLPHRSAANFHCSPAASMNSDGSFNLGSVTATASFRFSKWIGHWLSQSGAKLIIGKGGMSAEDYKKHFVPNGAIYLTTVGYGTGALLGRGVEKVSGVFWHSELGLAQAMWVIDVNKWALLWSRVICEEIHYLNVKTGKLQKVLENYMKARSPLLSSVMVRQTTVQMN